MSDGESPLQPSGVPGLDRILMGGFRPGRIYLVEGATGTGKTTLGIQFLCEGVRQGEPCMFVSLAEGRDEIEMLARSHGWELGELVVATVERHLTDKYSGSLFDVGEMELDARVREVLDQVAELRPRRVVLDTLTGLRGLSDQPARFRRAVEALWEGLTSHGATVLVVDEVPVGGLQEHPYSLAWGVLRLEQQIPEWGPARRRLCVVKVRGQDFSSGYHDLAIRPGGLEVFPSLSAFLEGDRPVPRTLSSGLEGVDRLLGGGVQYGTSIGVVGPPGCGKSTLVAQFVLAALERGERCALYLFEEFLENLALRARARGIDLEAAKAEGLLRVRAVGLGEMSSGEAAADMVRQAEAGARLVVIDSINGYRQAVGVGEALDTHLLGIFRQLGTRGVATFTTLSLQMMQSGPDALPADISYLTDTVIAQRYFEALGSMRYAISVVKKRFGDHERTIREYRIDEQGLVVGDPLSEFVGLLTGVPTYVGGSQPLL